MNIVDVVILVILLIALRRGMRLGLLILFLSAGGFVLGLYLGSLAAGALGGAVHNSTERVLAAVALCLIGGFLLAGVGEAIANTIAPHVYRWKLGNVDKLLGAIFEAAFVLFIVWLLASALSSIQTNNIGRAVRSSTIISTLNRALPPSPGLLSQLERTIRANGWPKAFIGNEPPHTPVPNNTAISDEVIRTAQKSVVRIEGVGCGGIVEGSGFVAQGDVVVTNAHVVAGITRPRVIANSKTYRAAPIYFDPDLDIALLRVSGLPLAPLPITADVLPSGSPVAVLGYPGGGPLAVAGGTVIDHLVAIGRDIYDRSLVARAIYEIQGDIEPGDSGGPMVDSQGRVTGVTFAKSISNNDIGYALLTHQVVGAIEQYGSSVAPVITGQCAAD